MGHAVAALAGRLHSDQQRGIVGRAGILKALLAVIGQRACAGGIFRYGVEHIVVIRVCDQCFKVRFV